MIMPNIKELSGCQMFYKKTLCQMGAFPEGVYHFYKSYKLFTQYTSYEVMFIDSEVTHHD